MPPDVRAPASDKAVALRLSAIVLAAFGLRFWGLRGQAPHSDEFFDLFNALNAASWADLMRSVRANPQHELAVPLINFLISRWTSNLTLLRLPNVLFGTLSVPLLFLIGRRVGGARLGLIAAGLLAVAMIPVEASRITGIAPLPLLLTLLSFESLLRALDSNSLRAWSACAAVLMLFAYAHPYAPLVAGMEGAWLLLLRRERFPAFAACALAAAAVFLPWHLSVVAPMLESREFHFSVYEGWSWIGGLLQTALTWGGGVFEENLYSAGAGLGLLRDRLAGLYVFGFLCGLWALKKRRGWTAEWIFIAGAIPAGVGAVLLSDWKIDYFFAPRQTLFVLPFYLLVVARGLDSLWEKAAAASAGLRRYGGALLPCAVLLLYSTILGLNIGRGVRNWYYFETFVRSYAGRARDGDVVVFDNTNSAVKFLYFFDPSAFIRVLPPRIYDSYYQFRLPENFVAARGGVRVGIFSIGDPSLSREEEPPRWRAAGLRGRRLILAGSDFPLTGEAKTSDFQDFLRGELAVRRGI